MLAFDYYPSESEKTIVMLHGLFGSARNFATLATELSVNARVFAYDARNHGRSPHFRTHNLSDLTRDLDEFLSEHSIQTPILLGHSMGGLTIMDFARLHPQKVKALIVLDIAPRAYPPAHDGEIKAQKLEVSQFSSRHEIDAAMQPYVKSPMVRQFLQMNLERDKTGHFRWANHIEAIENSYERTELAPFDGVLFEGPVLCVRGLRSRFICDSDVTLLHRAFPHLELEEWDAEHWLHYTHKDALRERIFKFLG